MKILKHIKTIGSFNESNANKDVQQIETMISEKTEENFNFIKQHFTDIPITFEQYRERNHIHCCETRINYELVGCAIFVIRDFKPNPDEIAIPEDVDYKLPRVHINYIRTLSDFKNKGIGKNMVEKIIEWSKLNDSGMVTANVKLDNKESQRLFTSCGFNKSKKLTSSKSNTFYLAI